MVIAGPDGVLLLDKPAGITSTRALSMARRALGSRKAGHTGTLDPFATGLLPLVFGEATKFSRFLIDSVKAYEATLRLGEETTTGDIEGPVVRRSSVRPGPEKVDAVLRRFLGVQRQVPPMHSAVHVDGRRLYEWAREGVEVAREARDIEVLAIERRGLEGSELEIAVRCSKGTYVRVLAEDIGRALGCGAHLAALRRTEVGPFRIGQAVSLQALQSEGPAQAAERLLPPEVLVAGLVRREASREEAERFGHGQAIADPGTGEGLEVALFDPSGRFLGVGRGEAGGRIAPLRLMAPGRTEGP